MVQIKITWKAFGDRPEANRFISSATLELDGFYGVCSNDLLLNSVYKVTNLQSDLAEFGGAPAELALWNSIKAVLPINRTHTSLSVGDEIQINRTEASIANQDGPTYRIANIGWEMVVA